MFYYILSEDKVRMQGVYEVIILVNLHVHADMNKIIS